MITEKILRRFELEANSRNVNSVAYALAILLDSLPVPLDVFTVIPLYPVPLPDIAHAPQHLHPLIDLLVTGSASRKVHQEITATNMVLLQPVFIRALLIFKRVLALRIGVEPLLRHELHVRCKFGLLHHELHGGLLSELELHFWLEVAEGKDVHEKIDGPVRDAHGEDAVVEAVHIVGDEHVRFDVDLSAVILSGRGEEAGDWAALVEDDGVAIDPENPLHALVLRLQHLVQQQCKNEGWFVPKVVDHGLAHNMQLSTVNHAVQVVRFECLSIMIFRSAELSSYDANAPFRRLVW